MNVDEPLLSPPRKRPAKVSPEQEAAFARLRLRGYSVEQAAKKCGVARSTGYLIQNRLQRGPAATQGAMGIGDAYDLIMHIAADNHTLGVPILDRYRSDEAMWNLCLNLGIASARIAKVAAGWINRVAEAEGNSETWDARALLDCERAVHLEEFSETEPA